MTRAALIGAPWRFDRHTALAAGPPGSLVAELDPALRGFGGIHGGYVAAIALRAMTAVAGTGQRTARSLTLTLLAPVADGAIEVVPVLERAGRTIAGASVRLRQDGATAATGVATFGHTRPGPARVDRRMPDVPPPHACEPLAGQPVPGSDGLLIEHRPAAPPLPLSGGDQARIVVWMRLSEDRPIDALSVLALADGAVPALYGCLDAFVPIPTLDLAIHFADLDAAAESRWVLGVFDNVRAGDGYTVEDGALWTPGGRLVLTARQLRRVVTSPRPTRAREDR